MQAYRQKKNTFPLFNKLCFIILLLSCFSKLNAQVSIINGFNYCNVRDNNLLKNKGPILGYRMGGAIRYYPFKKLTKFSIQNELLYNQKGYSQDLDKKYTFHFNYLSLPILFNYNVFEQVSFNAGIELSYLFSTNVKQGTNTYNNYDAGILLGVNCFEKHRVNLFFRYCYGLVPMLDYYTFDKLGNFTGNIHDIKNNCFSIGIKFNIYNEEIHLYK